MTMYLSVTPHIQPTHTMWREGRRLPNRFAPPSAYDEASDQTPAPEAVRRPVEGAEVVCRAAQMARNRDVDLAAKPTAALRDCAVSPVQWVARIR